MNDIIYVIVGDNGYGMSIKKEKVRKIAWRMRNPFVKKFADALSGYIWLSSQINDYNEYYYNSSRVLRADDLLPLDELIRDQYFLLTDDELYERDPAKRKKPGGNLRIRFGDSGNNMVREPVIPSVFHEEEVELEELADARGIF